MIKKSLSLVTATVLLSFLCGCTDAADSAEKYLDAGVERNYPESTLYLTSRDVDGSASFMPDPGQPDLMLLGTCFNNDRDDRPSIEVFQNSELITEFDTDCVGGEGYVGLVAELFNTDGGEVTVEISLEDAQDFAFRVLGINASL